MCFGGGDTTSTTTNVPAPLTPQEVEAQNIALQSLRMRAALMPYVLQQAGFTLTPEGSEWPIAKLPPSPEQQQLTELTKTSLGGANEAGQMMSSRLQSAQGMIPGLMRSVQASMPPGISGMGPTGQGQMGPMMGQGPMGEGQMSGMLGSRPQQFGAMPPPQALRATPTQDTAGGAFSGMTPELMQLLTKLLTQQRTG